MARVCRQRVRELEQCSRAMFGDMVVTTYMQSATKFPDKLITPLPITFNMGSYNKMEGDNVNNVEQKRASVLVDQLLMDIYTHLHTSTDYNSCTSSRSQKSCLDIHNLEEKGVDELRTLVSSLNDHVERCGGSLVRQLKRRDALRRQQEAHSDVITSQLRKRASSEGDTMRFTINPGGGESGYAEWSAAMKMVATLPGGIPSEFRRRLWLALANRHLTQRSIDWPRVERTCFSEWSHPADAELGVQIVKDLHRTGCSLFCGEDGQENQALLKRVLLAYARWNKAVGYCQGFNMLAALILQVTDKCERDALKIMIYLIEGVLPESYFADSLRGLSVDMAVFRELLRTRLPRLSKHLDTLQNAAKDGNTSYEPPLTNVFTMQWFLTLFSNCLPQPTVLRVWDLILLEGNEILLRTALAIWQTLADKILHVRSADEFYCIMGVLTRELLEFNLIDANTLIKAIVTIGPLPELGNLREHYMYNINPWGGSINNFYSEQYKQVKVYPKERLALDISSLKKQYLKLKQRQRQAHIIFSAAINRQPPPSAPVAMNHLLLGKSALVPAKRLGPPKGTIPPTRHPPSTLHWKDAPKQEDSSSSSSDTELCDDPGSSSSEDEAPELPVTSQLGDNQLSKSDTDLMILDNTYPTNSEQTKSSSVVDITVPNKIESENIIFDSASTSVKPDFDLKKYDLESDDDFDFEEFLRDRVQRLNQPEISEEEADKEEDRISYSRRNSERALQIIQENSLILHRILQCQSRLSPSPPLTHESTSRLTPSPPLSEIPCSYFTPVESHPARDDVAIIGNNKSDNGSCAVSPTHATSTSDIVKSYENKSSSIYSGDVCSSVNEINDSLEDNRTPSWLRLYEYENKTPTVSPSQSDFSFKCIQQNLVKSPEYGFKFHSILEKSKNLDEKYNTLIGNFENKRPLSFTLDSFNIERLNFRQSSSSDDLRSSKEESESQSLINLNVDSVKVGEKCFEINDSEISAECQEENDFSTSPVKSIQDLKYEVSNFKELKECDTENQTNEKYTISLDTETLRETSKVLGSPSKVFNPFPIQVSSRQNKDVAVKLGLYKK